MSLAEGQRPGDLMAAFVGGTWEGKPDTAIYVADYDRQVRTTLERQWAPHLQQAGAWFGSGPEAPAARWRLFCCPTPTIDCPSCRDTQTNAWSEPRVVASAAGHNKRPGAVWYPVLCRLPMGPSSGSRRGKEGGGTGGRLLLMYKVRCIRQPGVDPICSVCSRCMESAAWPRHSTPYRSAEDSGFVFWKLSAAV